MEENPREANGNGSALSPSKGGQISRVRLGKRRLARFRQARLRNGESLMWRLGRFGLWAGAGLGLALSGHVSEGEFVRRQRIAEIKDNRSK